MRSRSLAWSIALASLVATTTGCVRTAKVRPYSVATSNAPFTILLDDRLDGRLRIDKLIVVLDGAVIYNRVRDGYFTVPPLLAAMQIPEGDHTLQMLVRASAPCGILEQPRWSLELRSARSFTVRDRVLRLTIVLDRGSVTAPPEDMMSLHIVEGLGRYYDPNATPPIELPTIQPVDTRVQYVSDATGCPPLSAIAGERDDE